MNCSSSSLFNTQTLQGFVVLYVVAFHSGLTLTYVDIPVFMWLTSYVTRCGHVDVDAFFVISSFITAWITVLGPKGPEPANEFLVRRAFRFVPFCWLIPVLYSTQFNPVSVGILLTSSVFMPQANVDAPYSGYPPLYVGWPLNYEVSFYALCTVGSTLLGRRASGLAVLALFTTAIIAPFQHDSVVQGNPKALYRWAPPLQAMAANSLVLGFLLGAGLAWLYAAHRHRPAPAVAHVLMATGMATFVISTVSPVPKFDLLARGLPAGALSFGMVAMEHCGELCMPRVTVWLGELSYALYLTHLAVIEAIHRIVGRLAPEWIGTQLTAFVISLALTLVLAVLVHRYVELPSIALGRRAVKWMRSRRHA